MPDILFAVGEKVVVADDNFAVMHALNHPKHPQITTPKKGPIYTVRGHIILPHGVVGLWLAEIVNAPMAPGVPEPSWNQERFAKVPPVEEISLAEVLEESLAEVE
ncbi:hypothetical protein [Hymenobacter latericus]|uniref:hypothetical protein n=1 Tax=Hymenobacter sp. YIM 151858-1 TaxID=2987688 RepID=UPI0022266DC4|nr:hypothetical protein [Hymenobacter sp. YIM 151858-1]UYZ60139.1 hypothetical protein OIS50_04890 [Hymenobacter sp. YIM 151858-1]